MANVNGEVVQLKDYPIMFDNNTLPFFPTSWKQTPTKIQTLLQSEGGDDLIQRTRIDKAHIDAQFTLADDVWVKFFAQYNKKESFSLYQYSPLEEGYEQRIVRMESFSYAYRRKSEELTAVTGVWDVSFSLEEF